METSAFNTFESQLKSFVKQCLREVLAENTQQNRSSNDDDDLMYMKEAAVFLKMSVAALYGYTHRRLIPFSKMGRRNVFSKKVIREWIMSRNKKTADEIGDEFNAA
jgi:predicted DNA-binding transcriptional regulator AlpA